MIALDASALLAFLMREEGEAEVARELSRCCISSVNLSEVLARFARDGHDPVEVAGRLAALPVEVVPFGRDLAVVAAALAPRTAKLGLSLGDRACLALALSRRIPALTADRAWCRLRIGVEIRVVR
jgi:PIN domain nuclease of toxin-antitoxin system